MGEWLAKFMKTPWVAHIMRAFERFSSRLGSQFAAAITYFSVLAMVPILMFAFSLLGFTINVIDPSLITQATNLVKEQIGDAESAKQILDVILDTLSNWRGVGIVALLSAAYAGQGWIANIDKAINAMWRENFDITPDGGGPLKMVTDLLKNLLILVGLLFFGILLVAANSIASFAKGLVLGLFHLADSPVASVLTTVLGILVSAVVGWLLFVYLYTVLPDHRRDFKAVTRGALFGSIGLVLILNLGNLVSLAFANNKAAAIFGPIIVLMLTLNLFATIVMLGAAWTATARDDEVSEMQTDPGELGMRMTPLAERVEAEVMVPEKVAKRGVSVGLGAGYAVGGATGLGLGALIGRLLAARARRRR